MVIKKRIFGVLWLICTMTLLTVMAQATTLTSIHQQGDTVYAFLHQTEQWEQDAPGKLHWSEDGLDDLTTTLTPIADASTTMHYLFLVDCSGTTTGNKEDISAFLSLFLAQNQLPAIYSLATFGESFRLLVDATTDAGRIETAVSNLSFTAQYTDLVSGIDGVLAYNANRSRTSGELLEVVVITDALIDTLSQSPSISDYAATLAVPPGMELHTLGLESEDTDNSSALLELNTLGNGLHLQLGTSYDSSETCASELGLYVSELAVLAFPTHGVWPSETTAGFLWVTEAYGAIGPLPFASVERYTESGYVTPAESTPEEETPQEETPQEETPQEETPQEETPQEEAPQEETVVIEADQKDTGFTIPWAQICMVLGAVLVCAGVVVVVLYGKRHPKQTTATSGIRMRLDVDKGICKTKVQDLYLEHALHIGTDQTCQIRWKKGQMAPLQAKIILRDGIIYMEVINFETGVFLDGMRIHASTRLRSGNIIVIGETQFSLKF